MDDYVVRVSNESVEPEFESESESSPYSSVPIISVKAEVQGTPLEAGIDSGATINLLDEKVVRRDNMPSKPAAPIKLHQIMDLDSVNLYRKVTSDVYLL